MQSTLDFRFLRVLEHLLVTGKRRLAYTTSDATFVRAAQRGVYGSLWAAL